VEFRRARRRTWPGKPRGGPRGHTDAIWAGGKARAAPAGGARRRQASAGRGALAPASFRPGQGSGWRTRLYWVLGKAPGASVDSGYERNDGSTVAAPMAW
jgi:hypothetical protein